MPINNALTAIFRNTNANIWIMLVVALALLIVFYLLSCRLWGVKAAESK